MRFTKFSENSTIAFSSKKTAALNQRLIPLLHHGGNHEDIFRQGSYKSLSNFESLLVKSNRKLIRKNRKRCDNAQHAIVSIEAIFHGDNYVGCRFVTINDIFERMTGITDKQARGKLVNEIWPGTEANWGKAYTELTESGSPSTFIFHHAKTSKFFRCHLFNPGQDREHLFVIFKRISSQQAERTPL